MINRECAVFENECDVRRLTGMGSDFRVNVPTLGIDSENVPSTWPLLGAFLIPPALPVVADLIL